MLKIDYQSVEKNPNIKDYLYNISIKEREVLFYNVGDNEILYRLLLNCSCYEKIEIVSDGILCRIPVFKIKNKWRASSSVIKRISFGEVKKTYKPKALWMKDREIFFLSKLKKYKHFPKILGSGNDYIIMSYCGRAGMIKNEMRNQADNILEILAINKIKHRDITKNNLLVLDDCLYLIDFGWSINDDENDTPTESAERFRDVNNTDQKAMDLIFKSI